MRIYRLFKVVLYSIFILSICACASSPGNNIVSKKYFNYKTLQAGNIVIGGIVSVPETLSGKQRLAFAKLLEQALAKQYPDVDVQATAVILKLLSPNLYQQMLDSFRFHGFVSAGFMDIIQEQYAAARYLVYARIERDDISHDTAAKQAKYPEGPHIILNTVRTMQVSLLIYDLQARQTLVWGGGFQDGVSTSRRVFGNVKPDKLPTMMPTPPYMQQVLNDVLIGLVKGLPQPRQ